MGISEYQLKGLEKQDDDAANSLCGQTRNYSDHQIQFVVKQYREYSKQRQKVKIMAFMKYLQSHWKNQSWLTKAPSRKTVEDMLIANGLREAKPKTSKKMGYHEPVKKYFPHVQSVLDGKQVAVHINENRYDFVMEYSKDIATDAIGGFQIGNSESSDLVKGAFNQHSENYQRPLSSLIDNGSGNNKAAIDLGSEGTLFINTFPYRAQTKGHIEGEFGLFERTVSRIDIKGETEAELAMSFLQQLSKLYIRLRNKTPRCSVCPFTPAKLIRAKLNQKQAEQAYTALNNEQQKKEKQQEQRLKISEEFAALLDSIIKEHRLTGNSYRFKKSLKWVEKTTIHQAEQLFAVYSQKDNFDESKRTMAYVAAIARNLQQQKDQQTKQAAARRRYGLDQASKENRKKIEHELLLKKEQQRLEKEPNLLVVTAIKSHSYLPDSFSKTVNIFKNDIDNAIQILIRKSKQRQQSLIEKMKTSIMELNHLTINERIDWIQYVNERINHFLNLKVYTVTPNG